MTEIVQTQLTDFLMKMYERSTDAIFFFSKDGQLLHLNESAKNILKPDLIRQMFDGERDVICLACKGYTSTEALMTCNSCYFTENQEDFSSFQVYIETKGQGVLPYTASFHTIDDASGLRVLMLKALTKQMETQHQLYKNSTIKQVIQAQEDERKRISRELHDSVAQEILSSLVDIRVMRYLQNPEDVEEKLTHMEGSLSRLLDEIRNMSVELRPSTLDDLGIEAAFRSHFSWLEKNYGLEIHYTHEMQGKRFNNEIETVIYRIGQEAIFNALKYAEIDEVFVHLYEADGRVVLRIIDQGKGFDVLNYESKGTGLGLFGMKERAELVHGTIDIQSTIGKGTKITLEVPSIGGEHL